MIEPTTEAGKRLLNDELAEPDLYYPDGFLNDAYLRGLARARVIVREKLPGIEAEAMSYAERNMVDMARPEAMAQTAEIERLRAALDAAEAQVSVLAALLGEVRFAAQNGQEARRQHQRGAAEKLAFIEHRITSEEGQLWTQLAAQHDALVAHEAVAAFIASERASKKLSEDPDHD